MKGSLHNALFNLRYKLGDKLTEEESRHWGGGGGDLVKGEWGLKTND